jgi:hypothetical protein
MDAKKLPAPLRRYAAKIHDIDRDSDGFWSIGLEDGWICTETETHQIFEATPKEIAARFGAVVPCKCADCARKVSPLPS